MYDKGVLQTSEMHFYTPSKMAQEALYYLIYSGDFITNTDYTINRNNWNSYLILLLEEGQLGIQLENTTYTVEDNSVVLLNCFQPHAYFAKRPSRFKWFHFAGNASHYYCEHILQKHGMIFQDIENTYLKQLIDTIVEAGAAQHADEEFLSIKISQVLYELNQSKANTRQKEHYVITQAIRYMKENFRSPLTLETIAQEVNLSTYHFSRIFKKTVGESPIHFLIQLRLNESKYMLYNTNLTIAEIAYQSGFNSDSHFITTFKKHHHLTPNQFREMEF